MQYERWIKAAMVGLGMLMATAAMASKDLESTTDLRLIQTTPQGSTITPGDFLTMNPTAAQTYTYTIMPVGSWTNASVTLTNRPKGTEGGRDVFFQTTCNGTVSISCTVTFHIDTTTIGPLNFDPNTILLNVSGTETGTVQWKIAPVVGMYRQGGVVYWVGPNTGATTQVGYGKAMVAAITDVGTAWKWCTQEVCPITGSQNLGFFNSAGATSTTATGLTNTNAICTADTAQGHRGTTCAATGSDYPAAAAAQGYTGGGYTDWFLPAASTGNWSMCASGTGELCEMYRQQTIIDATATAGSHGGAVFDLEYAYWSSSERANYDAWLVYFDAGDQDVNNKDDDYNVRPVRVFTYSTS